MSEHYHTYRTAPSTADYRDGWERIFGRPHAPEHVAYDSPGPYPGAEYRHDDRYTYVTYPLASSEESREATKEALTRSMAQPGPGRGVFGQDGT